MAIEKDSFKGVNASGAEGRVPLPGLQTNRQQNSSGINATSAPAPFSFEPCACDAEIFPCAKCSEASKRVPKVLWMSEIPPISRGADWYDSGDIADWIGRG